MLKNILKLNGAQKLSNTELKVINGGAAIGCSDYDPIYDAYGNCPIETPCCVGSQCRPLCSNGTCCY